MCEQAVVTKRNKYLQHAADAGYTLIPFAINSYGRFHPIAERLVHHALRVMSSRQRISSASPATIIGPVGDMDPYARNARNHKGHVLDQPMFSWPEREWLRNFTSRSMHHTISGMFYAASLCATPPASWGGSTPPPRVVLPRSPAPRTTPLTVPAGITTPPTTDDATAVDAPAAIDDDVADMLFRMFSLVDSPFPELDGSGASSGILDTR